MNSQKMETRFSRAKIFKFILDNGEEYLGATTEKYLSNLHPKLKKKYNLDNTEICLVNDFTCNNINHQNAILLQNSKDMKIPTLKQLDKKFNRVKMTGKKKNKVENIEKSLSPVRQQTPRLPSPRPKTPRPLTPINYEDIPSIIKIPVLPSSPIRVKTPKKVEIEMKKDELPEIEFNLPEITLDLNSISITPPSSSRNYKKLICECGKQETTGNMARHKRSTLHFENMKLFEGLTSENVLIVKNTITKGNDKDKDYKDYRNSLLELVQSLKEQQNE